MNNTLDLEPIIKEIEAISQYLLNHADPYTEIKITDDRVELSTIEFGAKLEVKKF